MPVLVLALYVVTITKFFYRSNPQVRMYKTGVRISVHRVRFACGRHWLQSPVGPDVKISLRVRANA